MSNYISGFLVTLDNDIHGDDAEPVLAAIRQIRFVAAVEPVESRPLETQAAVTRRGSQWRDELLRLGYNGPQVSGDPA